MLTLQVSFWIAVACVAYTYVGYPLVLAVIGTARGKGRGRTLTREAAGPSSVSVVIAARNEEASIGRRTREFLETIQRSGLPGEVIIVSDGSTDRTAQAAMNAAAESTVACRVIDLPANIGKAAAITKGCQAAQYEIIVFADARQTWAPDALLTLVNTFADPTIGGASGDLVVETSAGVMQGVSMYWRYEKWLRCRESDVYSMVGATGAISAVRRELFGAIPAGTILDDVYWPLQVAMQGYRVVHNRGAIAYDRLPERAKDEFRRKVRTLSGNFQLAARLPGALLPWRNPIWLQFLSHKLMRLVVPWLLIAMLALCAIISHPMYRVLLLAQIAGYLAGIMGMAKAVGSRFRLASAAASFVVLNAAAWVSFWVWISGQAAQSWNKTTYTPAKATGTAVAAEQAA
jgi:cellulose synthase/poly-beta-1,6-N-acetylglucosamine synthase-like glycosyltransferase